MNMNMTYSVPVQAHWRKEIETLVDLLLGYLASINAVVTKARGMLTFFRLMLRRFSVQICLPCSPQLFVLTTIYIRLQLNISVTEIGWVDLNSFRLNEKGLTKIFKILSGFVAVDLRQFLFHRKSWELRVHPFAPMKSRVSNSLQQNVFAMRVVNPQNHFPSEVIIISVIDRWGVSL